MANTLFFVSLSLTIVSAFSFLPFLANAISSCNDACSTLNDRAGKLMIICINGKCNEDPDVGTHLCSRGSGQPSKGTCHSSGILACGNKYYFQYKCSPPATSSTRAHLTLNVSEGDDNGGPSKCDGQYHMNSSPVVSLSTGWYNHGSRCGKIIRITANNGRSVNAKVVDECDSINGCDKEHAYQPPCMYNIVDGSSAVWDALGLNKDLHIVDVTWSMA